MSAGAKQTLHGVLLVIFNKGVLLTGAPGIGKSDCALQLLSRNHQLVADDSPLVYKVGSQLMGSCPPSLQNLLEVRALGIIDMTQLFGQQAVVVESPIHFIIQLENFQQTTGERLITPKLERKMVLENAVPQITVNLALCQNAAILIESAVQWLIMTELADFQGY